MFQHKIGNYPYYESNSQKNGKVQCKNENKAPSDANKRGKGFNNRNNVWREAFSETSEELNALQVKFDCGERNKGGIFLECLWLMMAYLSTKLRVGTP